jgi:hypothetical protein
MEDHKRVLRIANAAIRASNKRIAALEAENARLTEALEDMVWQFAYRGVKGKRRMVGTGGLSALEGAFDALDWNDPHYPADSIGCDWPQCLNWGDACGCPHPGGYKHYCSEHSREGSALARAALTKEA